MIRKFCLVLALFATVAMGSPTVANQQLSGSGYFLPTTEFPSAQYIEGTVMSGSTFQSRGFDGYGTTAYPVSTLTYTDSINLIPTYSTAPMGTFASYPAASAAPPSVPPAYTTTSATGIVASGSGLAQQKAQQMAQMNMRGHLGGGLGGARYEGVGWSTVSPQHAIQQCCYWGQRPVSQIGVARGSDGSWYACVLYQ